MDRGESTRVTLPPEALEQAGLRAGDKVTISVSDGTIHVTKGKVVPDE
jgi:antitoxin component of MazEF toxin-antitoxin module